MNEHDRDALIEAAATAHRERDASGRILPSPAWMDLAPGDRDAAFAAQVGSRVLEAAWDEAGRTSTAAVVIRRARRLQQLEPPTS